MNIAVLLTCHNRKEKTINCLTSLYKSNKPSDYILHTYLVDDGSSDGTAAAVIRQFPEVNIIHGDGNLFWAGGMRMAWQSAISTGISFDFYLLLNDDVVLNHDFLGSLLITHKYALKNYNQGGIYALSTTDEATRAITYGGNKIIRNHLVMHSVLIQPSDCVQPCDMVNANILMVSANVIRKIGIFSHRFTHGIADYDYSRRAHRVNIPVLLAPGIGGTCSNDHSDNWKNADTSLKERISYLKSPKGLACNEYLYFIRTHFPLYLPYSFILLWLKTICPKLWEKRTIRNY